MASKIAFVFFLLALTSCGIISKKEKNDGLNAIQLHGTIHIPYCGGAKPSPDVAKGYYESMKFEKFRLLKGTDFLKNPELIQEVNLDEAGNVLLNLPAGDYLLVREDKFLSLSDFISKNGPSQPIHYLIKEDECFDNWKKTADLQFKVQGDTIIELRKKAQCWIGTNPCIEYIGPQAP